MAESKCEFSSETEFDDPAIEQWVVDNCEAVGEAIDNLFHDDYIGEWNVWQDTGNRLTAHVDTGSNAMGYMATVAHAPYNWGKLFDHAMAQLPSGDTTEVAAQDAKGRQWGATSVTAVYEMIATDLQPKYKDHENAFILASMGGSPSMMDEKLKLAEADIASVKFLVAALETQVPSATAPLTPAQEAAGWNNEHRLGSNEYGSLVWFKTLVGYLETILSDLRIVVDELLRLKKSWDEVFFNNHDAATKARDAFHAKCRHTKSCGYGDDAKKLRELSQAEKKWKALTASRNFKYTRQVSKVITPEQAKSAITRPFKEQCLLLSNIYKLAQYKINFLEDPKKSGRYGKKLPYTDNVAPDIPAGPKPEGKPGEPPPVVPYVPQKGNASLMVQSAPWGFINKLTQDSNYSKLLDIPTQLLSQLSPKISLYKVASTDFGASEEVTEIKFDTHYDGSNDLENVFKNRDKRGFGVGLKSFNFSYEGSNPFAVKKSIKAKLVIFASSFDDLLAKRGNYRYADLALKTGGNLEEFLDRTNQTSDVIMSNVTKLNFRLRAVVGWHMPTGRWEDGQRAPADPTKNGGTTLQKAVYNSFVTLNLTPTIHEFDIDEMGRVVFTINYLAYIEDFFDQPNFNIFANKDNHIEAMKRKMKIAAWNEGCTPEQASDLKEAEAKKVEKEKKSNLNTVLGNMLKQDKIMFLPIARSELRAFNEKGPFYNVPLGSDVPTFGNVAAKDKVKKSFKAALDATAKSFKDGKDLSTTPIADMNRTEYISFFYVSDLIDVVLENIESSLGGLIEGLNKASAPTGLTAKDAQDAWSKLKQIELERIRRLQFNFKHFRVILGPLELVDFRTGVGGGRGYRDTNLGDVAISVPYFMDWLTQKVLSKETTIYTLPNFLNDLLNGLVRNFLNTDTCYDINIKQKTRVFQSVVTSYTTPAFPPGRDEITHYIMGQRKGGGVSAQSRLALDEIKYTEGRKSGVLNTMGVRDMPINERTPEREYNYLIYYAGRTQPLEHMQGLKDADAEKGIFHYLIGKPDGLVKTIKLTKTDSPGLKEVRFEQEGFDGLSQLRETYDATIECYGSPNIVPGTYIYIDPKGFAPKNKEKVDTYKYKGQDGKMHIIDRFLLTRYGIGGYYMVIRTENNLAAGEFNTTITAKWVAELGVGENGDKRPYAGPMPSKCSTQPKTLQTTQ